MEVIKVLVFGKSEGAGSLIKLGFETRSDFPFDVTITSNVTKVKELLTSEQFDVLVLGFDDKCMDLLGAVNFEFGAAKPFRFVYLTTDLRRPYYHECVMAMRNLNVQDFIVISGYLTNRDGKTIIDSIVNILKAKVLDEVHKKVIIPWLHTQIYLLNKNHPGELIAVWHDPEPHVLANAKTGFELHELLTEWRQAHLPYEKPFITRVPYQLISVSD